MTVQASDPRSGLFRFQHHDVPLEWSPDVDDRLFFIAAHKPLHEVEKRLLAILRVPDALVPVELASLGRAFCEAKRAFELSWRDYKKFDEARRSYTKAFALAFLDPLAFALSLGPLPDGVTWRNGGLRFGP